MEKERTYKVPVFCKNLLIKRLKDCQVNILNIFWHLGKLEFRPYIGTDLWGNIVKMSKII